MSQVSQYSDLYPFLIPQLPGSTPALVLQALQAVGRRFCSKTEAFRDDLDPLAVVDYQQDYDISTLHSYDASIHRVRSVRLGGVLQATEYYSLRDEKTLRFVGSYVPHDQDDRLLTCGVAGTTTLADWTAISDASATVSIDTSTYGLTDMDLTDCADFDAIALVLQTALRAEIPGNTGYCRWNHDATRFLFWVDSGTIGVLTAGSEGTDISGSGYLNGVTGTGTLSGMMDVNVVFRPHIRTDTLPDWFLDRWTEAIVAGAMHYLTSQKGRQWYSAEMAVESLYEYNAGVTSALAEKSKEYKNNALAW